MIIQLIHLRISLRMPPYIIKYKLVKKLGPTNKPNQKITFPSTVLPFNSFVLLSVTNGICNSCMVNRYPLTFLNRIAMQSSCTSALSKKVTNVAAFRLRWNVEMLEW